MSAPAKGAPFHADAAGVFINDAAVEVNASARRALAAIAEGDTLRTYVAALKRLLTVTPADTIAQCRRLADETTRAGGYIF
jgi:hypothetical protein